jgi:hypothetical protein
MIAVKSKKLVFIISYPESLFPFQIFIRILAAQIKVNLRLESSAPRQFETEVFDVFANKTAESDQ